jgi:14-3-3 protein epsilon
MDFKRDVVLLAAHLHREALCLLTEATGAPLRGLGSGCTHLALSNRMKKKLRNIDVVVGWVEKLSLPLIEQFLQELSTELKEAAGHEDGGDRIRHRDNADHSSMELDVAKVTGKGHGTKHQYDATGRFGNGTRHHCEATGRAAEIEPSARSQQVAVSRDKRLYLAKLADQAERFDEMADHMAEVCNFSNELSAAERNCFSLAFKNAVGSRREAWHSFNIEELKEKSECHEDYEAWARENRIKVEVEVQTICNTALGILDQSLIPKASNGEFKVFYLNMKADINSYIAEFTTGEAKAKAVDSTAKAYAVAAAAVAGEDLAVTHPIRLGFALSYSAFLHKVQLKPEEARKVANMAFEDANAELGNVREDWNKDSSLILQLLSENLKVWGAACKEEYGEEQKAKKMRVGPPL